MDNGRRLAAVPGMSQGDLGDRRYDFRRDPQAAADMVPGDVVRDQPEVVAEQRGRGIGRIRLRRVKDVSAESLLAFLQEAVEPGATIHTDGWRGYAGLPAAGYRHQVTVISGGSEPAHEVMPRVHKVAALLKRWLLGTLQGGIQHQHLDYYLDEFTFRFNRRRSQARGLLFHRLVQQAAAVGPAPYHSIIKPSISANLAELGE